LPSLRTCVEIIVLLNCIGIVSGYCRDHTHGLLPVLIHSCELDITDVTPLAVVSSWDLIASSAHWQIGQNFREGLWHYLVVTVLKTVSCLSNHLLTWLVVVDSSLCRRYGRSSYFIPKFACPGILLGLLRALEVLYCSSLSSSCGFHANFKLVAQCHIRIILLIIE
jgi:hypothetical protein